MAVNKVVYGGNTLIDLTSDTVVASDILSGKTAHSKSGAAITGSMTNRGAVTKTLDTSTTSYTIVSGYHNGSGKVNIAIETKSVTPTKSAQNITPSSGKVLSKVTVNAIPAKYVDTSSDTVTAATLLTGITAHDKSGAAITGTMTVTTCYLSETEPTASDGANGDLWIVTKG